MVKNLPAKAGDTGDLGSGPGWEDLLEKGMAIHSSIFALENLMHRDPGGLQSMGSQRVGHNLATEHTCINFNSGQSVSG